MINPMRELAWNGNRSSGRVRGSTCCCAEHAAACCHALGRGCVAFEHQVQFCDPMPSQTAGTAGDSVVLRLSQALCLLTGTQQLPQHEQNNEPQQQHDSQLMTCSSELSHLIIGLAPTALAGMLTVLLLLHDPILQCCSCPLAKALQQLPSITKLCKILNKFTGLG
jgi:hypothetical protein